MSLKRGLAFIYHGEKGGSYDHGDILYEIKHDNGSISFTSDKMLASFKNDIGISGWILERDGKLTPLEVLDSPLFKAMEEE